MPSQDDFARALIEPDRPPPPVIIARGDRFDIYRNNVFASLGAALAKTFPVVETMLGGEYFSALALAFARQSLPKSRILAEYGADFPDFIAQFPPLTDYPYLADVARLEWSRIEAFRAADDEPNRGTVVGDALLNRRVKLGASARLLASPHPIDTLWRLHQTEQPGEPAQWDGEQLVLFRQADTLVHWRLLPTEFEFLGGLRDNPFLGDALWSISEPAAAAHALRLVIQLLEAGALVISPPHHAEPSSY